MGKKKIKPVVLLRKKMKAAKWRIIVLNVCKIQPVLDLGMISIASEDPGHQQKLSPM